MIIVQARLSKSNMPPLNALRIGSGALKSDARSMRKAVQKIRSLYLKKIMKKII